MTFLSNSEAHRETRSTAPLPITFPQTAETPPAETVHPGAIQPGSMQPDRSHPGSIQQKVAHREDRILLFLAVGLLGASLVAGAAIGASRLNLYVPAASRGSLDDATAILIHNLEVCALLVAATMVQPRGIPRRVAGFLPQWMTDMTVALVVSLNLVAIGGVIGALGLHAFLRVVPHAPFELGGYFVVVVGYLRARRGQLERGDAIRGLAIAVALLVCGAFVESYISGAVL